MNKYCEWQLKHGKRCGARAQYLLGYPDEQPVPICSLHFSRASTFGWPVKKMPKPPLDNRPGGVKENAGGVN
jgi:hypothetical protein